MYIYYVCGNLNPLEPFRRLHGHVPICGAGTTSATTCNTVAGAWSRFASSFICCSLLHAMATKAVTFTKSGEEAVKLKRPRIRRPFCIVSDEMLALPLLPWWARSSANNSAISTSSSRRDVGRRQQGLELKTPGSSNWARAVFASARVFGLWFKLRRHRDSVTRLHSHSPIKLCIRTNLPILFPHICILRLVNENYVHIFVLIHVWHICKLTSS